MALRSTLNHFVVSSLLAAPLVAMLPLSAEAHVKWFCAFNVAGRPAGLSNILCGDFEKLVGLAIGILLLGCLVDRTFIGEALTRVLDRVTAPFRESRTRI